MMQTYINEKQISIIIPVYNVKYYIEDCLNDLIKQEFIDYEIICVDDSSSDGTYEILLEYAKLYENIHIYRNDFNIGAAECRNKGLKYASGKYVIFLDSDDRFHKYLLKELYAACENNVTEISCCLYALLDETSDMKLVYWKEEVLHDNGVVESERKKIELLNYPIFSPWNKLVLKEFLLKEKISFQDIPNANDVYYSLMVMTLANKISIVNERLVYYRNERQGNISEDRDKKKSYVIFAFQKYIESLKCRNMWIGELKKCISRMIIKQCYGLVIKKTQTVKEQLLFDFQNNLQLFMDENTNIFSEWESYKYKYLCGDIDKVYDNKYQAVPKTINKFFGEKKGKKIALWGAGRLSIKLIDAIGELRNNIVYIIDNDIRKQGTMLAGIEIVSFENIYQDIEEIIVLNPKFLNDIEKQVGDRCKIINFEEIIS